MVPISSCVVLPRGMFGLTTIFPHYLFLLVEINTIPRNKLLDLETLLFLYLEPFLFLHLA